MGYFLGMVASLTTIKSTARLASSESQASSVFTEDRALSMWAHGGHLPLTERRWLRLNDLESVSQRRVNTLSTVIGQINGSRFCQFPAGRNPIGMQSAKYDLNWNRHFGR
jgi:hypothetical protein